MYVKVPRVDKISHPSSFLHTKSTSSFFLRPPTRFYSRSLRFPAVLLSINHDLKVATYHQSRIQDVGKTSRVPSATAWHYIPATLQAAVYRVGRFAAHATSPSK